MICVSIGRGRHKHVLAEHRHLVEQGASLVELRLDYINGEITLLGRLHDVPTPANQAVQTTAREIARRGLAPGSIPPDELRSRIQRVGRSFGS